MILFLIDSWHHFCSHLEVRSPNLDSGKGWPTSQIGSSHPMEWGQAVSPAEMLHFWWSWMILSQSWGPGLIVPLIFPPHLLISPPHLLILPPHCLIPPPPPLHLLICCSLSSLHPFHHLQHHLQSCHEYFLIYGAFFGILSASGLFSSWELLT